MERILALFLGYCIGNIQTAYLITKYVAKIDIREQGSGNAGATNVIRTLGAKYGALVLVLDIFKGIIACSLALLIFDFKSSQLILDLSSDLPMYTIVMYAGVGAVLGHNFPIVLDFKGGKGAATTLGVIIYINWIVGILLFLSGLILAKFTKYVSLSSILCLSLSTVVFFLLGYNIEVVIISLVLSILTLYQHRANIVRLLNGTERKFGSSKK